MGKAVVLHQMTIVLHDKMAEYHVFLVSVKRLSEVCFGLNSMYFEVYGTVVLRAKFSRFTSKKRLVYMLDIKILSYVWCERKLRTIVLRLKNVKIPFCECKTIALIQLIL